MNLKEFQETIKLSEFKVNEVYPLYGNEANTPWLNEIVDEIEQDLDREEKELERSIEANLEVKRMVHPVIMDHLFIRGTLESSYHLPCIRCLTPIPEKQEVSIKCKDSNIYPSSLFKV